MSWICEEKVTLPNIYKVLSINPRALNAVKELNEAISFGGSCLSRVQEEAISTVVSAVNGCRY